jgi:hypothetical protein
MLKRLWLLRLLLSNFVSLMMRAQQLQNDCPQALAALDITRIRTCVVCMCIYFFAPLVCHFLPQIVFTARIISLDIKNSARFHSCADQLIIFSLKIHRVLTL